MTEEAYALAFLKEFGLKTLDDGKLYRHPLFKLPLRIDKMLFMDKPKNEPWSLKANKEGRGPYLRLLAQAIKNPYEIWEDVVVDKKTKKTATVLRFIRLFRGDGENEDVGGFSVFKLYKGKLWSGSTVFNPKENKRDLMLEYLEKQRTGVLLWREK